jgi:hypothetical protein
MLIVCEGAQAFSMSIFEELSIFGLQRDRVGPMPVSSHSTDTRQARQKGTIKLCGMSDAPRPSYLV